jgi:hypothetical protein
VAEEPTVAGGRRRWPWAGWKLLAAALVVTAAKLAWALTVISGRLYPPLPDAELGQIEDQRDGSSWIPSCICESPTCRPP